MEDRIRVELMITLFVRFVSGVEGTRTLYLFLAKEALSLMSYNPMVRTSRPVSAPGSLFAS